MSEFNIEVTMVEVEMENGPEQDDDAKDDDNIEDSDINAHGDDIITSSSPSMRIPPVIPRFLSIPNNENDNITDEIHEHTKPIEEKYIYLSIFL